MGYLLSMFPLMLFLGLFLSASHSEGSSIIKKLVQATLENSPQVKAAQKRALADQVDTELNLLDYRFSSELSFEYEKIQNPQTPLSATFFPEQRTASYGLGLSKKWKPGFSTSLDYSLSDFTLEASNSSVTRIYTPELSLTFSTQLFRDLIGGESKYLFEEVKARREAAIEEAKLTAYNTLIDSMVQFASLVSLKQDLQVQNKLCKNSGTLLTLLKKKRRRKTISEISYLLSLRDHNSCKSTQTQLENNLQSGVESFTGQFFFAPFIEEVSIEKVFSEIMEMYKGIDDSSFKGEQSVAIKTLKAQLEALEKADLRYQASSRTNLSLSASTGLQGTDSSSSEAQEQIVDTMFPFVRLEVSLPIPFSDRADEIQRVANNYRKEALRQEYLRKLKEDKNRSLSIHQSIAKNLEVFNTQKQNSQLNEKIYFQARKDFNNGRIDFNQLSIYYKELVSSRAQLSEVQLILIQEMIEALDYANAFEKVMESNT